MEPGRRNYCQISMSGAYALLDLGRPIPGEGETITDIIPDSLQPVGNLRRLRITDRSDIKFLKRYQDVTINGRVVPFYSVLVLGKRSKTDEEYDL